METKQDRELYRKQVNHDAEIEQGKAKKKKKK